MLSNEAFETKNCYTSHFYQHGDCWKPKKIWKFFHQFLEKKNEFEIFAPLILIVWINASVCFFNKSGVLLLFVWNFLPVLSLFVMKEYNEAKNFTPRPDEPSEINIFELSALGGRDNLYHHFILQQNSEFFFLDFFLLHFLS